MTIQVATDNEDFYGLPHESVSALNASGKCVTDGETSSYLTVDRGCFERGCMGYDHRDKGEVVEVVLRNTVIEEVAREIDKLPFGDTTASCAIFVRNMKK